MSISNTFKSGLAVAVLAASAIAPGVTAAQTPATGTPGKWYFGAELYLYLPSIGGSVAFPVRGSGSNINVDADTLIDGLDMAFMGALAAHNGQWGFFTDVMYLDVSGDKSNTRDFSINGVPGSITADLDLGLKGTIWTLGGEYRVVTNRAWTMDVLAGARMFAVKPKLSWSLGVASPSLPGLEGSEEVKETNWDAIVGVRGRYTFGDRREWFVPYYLDVGTGESDLTWQAMAGIGYSYNSWDFTAAWRYLDYNFKSDSKINDMNFNGPMFGVIYRW